MPNEKPLTAGAYVGLELGTGASWSGDGDTLRLHTGAVTALTPGGAVFSDPYRKITVRATRFLNDGAQLEIQVTRG